MKKNALYLTLALVLAAALAIALYLPPLPRAASRTEADFSIDRAWADMIFLAQSPREAGSEHNLKTRVWIEDQMRALGCEVQEQPFEIENHLPGVNIAARLPGTRGTPGALFVVAHYDTAAGSPGASDNASGTVVALEIARKLAAGPRPANDVVFLFTDAEELGVFGAAAFVESHPWAADARMVLNFDNQSYGPSFIWNTSSQNGPIISAYERLDGRPFGSAWVDRIARTMPIDTDLSPFLRAGAGGVNFTTPNLSFEAHTPGDDLSQVNRASLQHAGEQGLAFTSALANADLSQMRGPDRVYFNPAGGWMVHYGPATARILGTLALLALAGAVLVVARRQTVSVRGVVLSAFLNLILVIFLPIITLGFWIAAYLFMHNSPEELVMATATALALLMAWRGYAILVKSTRRVERLLVSLVIWGLLAGLTGWSDIFLSQPLTSIFFLAAAGAALVTAAAGQRWAPAAAAVCLTGSVFLLAPVVYLLLRITGPIAIPAMAASAILALSLLLFLPITELILKKPDQPLEVQG